MERTALEDAPVSRITSWAVLLASRCTSSSSILYYAITRSRTLREARRVVRTARLVSPARLITRYAPAAARATAAAFAATGKPAPVTAHAGRHTGAGRQIKRAGCAGNVHYRSFLVRRHLYGRLIHEGNIITIKCSDSGHFVSCQCAYRRSPAGSRESRYISSASPSRWSTPKPGQARRSRSRRCRAALNHWAEWAE